jgi:RNA polymerase sigma-70 factor (ECF subfamily)
VVVTGSAGGPPVEELADADLLAAHVAGDPDAFGVLFRRHRDRLWAVALRTTGDREEAADALQEAMVAAFRRAASFRGEAQVTTWLHRIVVNACLDRLRRNRTRAARPLPDDLEEYAARGAVTSQSDSGGGGVDPEARVLGAERRELVLRALAQLPVEQRAALVLVDMEGLPVEEAARGLDCPAGTVKSRCSRGRARLAGLLAAADVVGHDPGGGTGGGTRGGTGHGLPPSHSRGAGNGPASPDPSPEGGVPR